MNPTLLIVGGIGALFLLGRMKTTSVTNPNVGTAGVLSQVNNLMKTLTKGQQATSPQAQSKQSGGGAPSPGAGAGGSANKNGATSAVPTSGQQNIDPNVAAAATASLMADGWTAADIKQAQESTGYDVSTIAQLSQLGVTQDQMTLEGTSVFVDPSGIPSEATSTPEQQAAAVDAWALSDASNNIASGAQSDYSTDPSQDPNSYDYSSYDYSGSNDYSSWG